MNYFRKMITKKRNCNYEKEVSGYIRKEQEDWMTYNLIK